MTKLEMYRGYTAEFTIPVTQGGVTMDITDCDLWMTAKYSPKDSDDYAVFQLTTDGGDIVIADQITNEGDAIVTIPPSATENLPYTRVQLFYDVKLRDTTQDEWSVDSGVLIVRPNITRVS